MLRHPSALVEALNATRLVPLGCVLLVHINSLHRLVGRLVEHLRGILSFPLLSIRSHDALGLFQIDAHLVVRFESIHVCCGSDDALIWR